MKHIIAALLCLASPLMSTPAKAGPIAFDGAWEQQRFSLFQQNRYGFAGNRLDVASDGAVSLTYRALAPSDWGSASARWDWSVSEGVGPTDLRQKGGDDRNLAMYFVFLPEAEAQALQGAPVRRLLRNDAVRVLIYVWGGAHDRGDILSSPYLGARGKTVVLRPSGTGSASENVNLSGDYARAFGGSKGALVGIAVSADSDDTDSRIRASISGLRID